MVAIPGGAGRLGDMPKGEPVPEGVYHVRVDKADYKMSKAKDGKPSVPMAETTFTIFGPDDAEQYHGRKFFENLMLAGEGRYRLRSLLTETGHDEDFELTDTDQLLNLEVAVVVAIQPAGPGADGKHYDARNKIVRFQSIGA